MGALSWLHKIIMNHKIGIILDYLIDELPEKIYLNY